MLAIMLGHSQPLDICTGQKIDVDKSLSWSNDKEFHHFFPQAFLARVGVRARESNVVGNIVLLTSASNIFIADKPPSKYLKALIEKVGREELLRRLATNLVPEEALSSALEDDYTNFLVQRSLYLHSMAERLAGVPVGNPNEINPDEIDDMDSDPTE